jgi:hypothetical protein
MVVPAAKWLSMNDFHIVPYSTTMLRVSPHTGRL